MGSFQCPECEKEFIVIPAPDGSQSMVDYRRQVEAHLKSYSAGRQSHKTRTAPPLKTAHTEGRTTIQD